MKIPNPRLECPDGFSVSIQAGQCMYSSPRDDFGPYSAVELGYPSDVPPWYVMEYCEDSEAPTNTVYGYVPVPLVVRMLKEHGLDDFRAFELLIRGELRR